MARPGHTHDNGLTRTDWWGQRKQRTRSGHMNTTAMTSAHGMSRDNVASERAHAGVLASGCKCPRPGLTLREGTASKRSTTYQSEDHCGYLFEAG